MSKTIKQLTILGNNKINPPQNPTFQDSIQLGKSLDNIKI